MPEHHQGKGPNSQPNASKSVTPASPQGQAMGAVAQEGLIRRSMADPRALSSADLRHLQGTIGNRAVSRILGSGPSIPQSPLVVQPKLKVGPARDRYEEEADKIAAQVVAQPSIHSAKSSSTVNRKEDEEFTLSKSISSMTQSPNVNRQARSAQESASGFDLDAGQEGKIRAASGGSPLADSTRSFMESRFGADFSGVRVHTGNEANTLNRQMDAKAFTHRNHIYFGANGSPSDSRLLAHELTHVVQQGAAGSTAAGSGVQRAPKEGFIQRKGVIDWVKNKFSKKNKTPTTGTASTTNTTAPTTTTTTTTDTKPKYQSDSSRELADSVDYEQRLGRYAYNHAKATVATKDMLDKMIKVMIGDLDKIDEEDDATRSKITSTFGKDDHESAGQVGAKFEPVLEVLKQGNLREQLTALMNAMFGPFKDYLRTAVKKERWAELQGKGLNVDKLKRRRKQMKYIPGADDLYRNPYLKYDRKGTAEKHDFGSNMRNDVKGTSNRTIGEMEQGDNPIGLSDREKALQYSSKKPNEVGGEKLKWMEGATKWQINDNNPWVKEAKNSLKMPVISGPSGTMMRMLQLWEWLSKPVPITDWRLAVLGWMLTSNDHSFHEMMIAAADYGLPYKPGQQAYMDIAPLTVNELRSKVAKGGLFPHEIEFERKFKGGAMKTIMEDDAFDDADEDIEDMDSKEAGALSGPAAAAIKLYTSFGYLILNPVLRGGPQAEEMIRKAIMEKDELEDFKDDLEDGKLDIKQLMAEAREVVPMLESALTMLPDWSGHVYRGAAYDTTWVYRGKTFTFDKVGSASTKEDTAKDFANNFNKGKYKYILEMDVTAGKDLSKVSEVANEDEVVLPPGSKFTITKRTTPTKTDPYYRIFMTQTGRGSAKLDLGERPSMSDDSTTTSSDYDSSDSDSSEEEFSGPINLEVYDSTDGGEVYMTLAPSEAALVEDEGVEKVGWSKVYYVSELGDFYAKTDQLAAYLNQGKPKKKSPPPKKSVAKKPITLFIDVYKGVGQSGFNESNPKEITSHKPHPTEAGWSFVTLSDSDTVTYAVETSALNEFLGIVKDDDSESVSSSEEDSSSQSKSGNSNSKVPVSVGLSTKDYPAGDYKKSVNSFLTLLVSKTEDGILQDRMELQPGDDYIVQVTDELTKKNGRGKITFFSHVFYVSLRAALGDLELESESEGEDDIILIPETDDSPSNSPKKDLSTSSEESEQDDESFFTESGEEVSMNGTSGNKSNDNVFLLPLGGAHLDAKNPQGKSIGTIRPPATVIATGKTKDIGTGILGEFIYEGTHYWCWTDWWPMYFDEKEYPAK